MYLLDSQALMDLFGRNRQKRVFKWLDRAKPGPGELFISVLSLGQIAYAVEDMQPGERNDWRRLQQEGRRSFEDQGTVIDIDSGIVAVWQSALRDERLSDIPNAAELLGEDDRLIISTAIARGYALVSDASPVLEEIARRTTLSLAPL